ELRLRAHELEARSVRVRAGEVHRLRPGPIAPGVVVPLRRRDRARAQRRPRCAVRHRLRAMACGMAFKARATSFAETIAMSELSHVDDSGAVRMVDVGDKPLSRRRAV